MVLRPRDSMEWVRMRRRGWDGDIDSLPTQPAFNPSLENINALVQTTMREEGLTRQASINVIFGVAALEQSLGRLEYEVETVSNDHDDFCNEAMTGFVRGFLDVGNLVEKFIPEQKDGDQSFRRHKSNFSVKTTALISKVKIAAQTYSEAFDAITRTDEKISGFSASEVAVVRSRVEDFKKQCEKQIDGLNSEISGLNNDITFIQNGVQNLTDQIARSHALEESRKVTRGLKIGAGVAGGLTGVGGIIATIAMVAFPPSAAVFAPIMAGVAVSAGTQVAVVSSISAASDTNNINAIQQDRNNKQAEVSALRAKRSGIEGTITQKRNDIRDVENVTNSISHIDGTCGKLRQSYNEMREGLETSSSVLSQVLVLLGDVESRLEMCGFAGNRKIAKRLRCVCDLLLENLVLGDFEDEMKILRDHLVGMESVAPVNARVV